jgi:CDP-diacylglycerol--glycerol-3-phosphate 3-phosphatidyltransferase
VNHPQGATAGPQKHWDTLTDWVRAHVAAALNPVARFLARRGVHANTVTLVGFLLQAGIGTLFALGRIRLGGILLAVVGPMDALDGAVARANGQERPFGAFLDSTLDRLSDAVLILGLTAYHLQQGALLHVGLLLVALVSALMVSYTRARAEALGLSCKVGLLTRMERISLIAVLAILDLVTPLAWALAILSLFTFLQRVVHVYRTSSSRE